MNIKKSLKIAALSTLGVGVMFSLSYADYVNYNSNTKAVTIDNSLGNDVANTIVGGLAGLYNIVVSFFVAVWKPLIVIGWVALIVGFFIHRFRKK